MNREKNIYSVQYENGIDFSLKIVYFVHEFHREDSQKEDQNIC